MPRSPEVASMPMLKKIAFGTIGILSIGLAADGHLSDYDQNQVHATSVGEAMVADISLANKIGGACLLDLQLEACPTSTTVPEASPVPEPDLKDQILAKLPTTTTTTKPQHNQPVVHNTAPATSTQSQSTSSPPPAAVSGDKEKWMAAAGISPDDYRYVDYIFTHESGWVPSKVSPKNCIGLGQNCPNNGDYWLDDACPDWQSGSEDSIICQIRRFAEYAKRWGGWAGSYNHWIKSHWW